MMTFPTYGKIKNVPNQQPVNLAQTGTGMESVIIVLGCDDPTTKIATWWCVKIPMKQ